YMAAMVSKVPGIPPGCPNVKSVNVRVGKYLEQSSPAQDTPVECRRDQNHDADDSHDRATDVDGATGSGSGYGSGSGPANHDGPPCIQPCPSGMKLNFGSGWFGQLHIPTRDRPLDSNCRTCSGGPLTVKTWLSNAVISTSVPSMRSFRGGSDPEGRWWLFHPARSP